MGNIIQAPKSTTRLGHPRLHVWDYAIQLVRLVKAAPIGERGITFEYFSRRYKKIHVDGKDQRWTRFNS